MTTDQDLQTIDQAIDYAAEILGLPREELIVFTDTAEELREEWPIERFSLDIEPTPAMPKSEEKWKGNGKRRMPRQR